MKLSSLLSHFPILNTTGSTPPEELEIDAISSDSRTVQPNSLFIAIAGSQSNGLDFIDQSIKKGAIAILSSHPRPDSLPASLTWIQTLKPRSALSHIAAIWNHFPSKQMKVVGITGTNGKTTTSFLTHAIMESVWGRVGLLGTVKINNGIHILPATHTTPDSISLQKHLADMATNQCRGVVMEVSSHGIDQGRCESIDFDTAVFTNLSQDHLDYHGTMQAYYETKKALFYQIAKQPSPKKTTAIIHTDDPYGQKLYEELEGTMYRLSYGFGAEAQMRIGRLTQSLRGMDFELFYKNKSYLVHTPFIGKFNALNATAALANALCCGIGLRKSIQALSHAPQVPGRMEKIGRRDGCHFFVDYAHTPDALQKALLTLRELNPQRIITVFGCGGNRDMTKRPLMGKAVAQHSDFSIITSDNPRNENPETIIQEIEKGIGHAPHISIADRRLAILQAVNLSEDGDIVLVAGKGHEVTQEIDGTFFPFDDAKVLRYAMANKETTKLS